jgi:hypothetical protein
MEKVSSVFIILNHQYVLSSNHCTGELPDFFRNFRSNLSQLLPQKPAVFFHFLYKGPSTVLPNNINRH